MPSELTITFSIVPLSNKLSIIKWDFGWTITLNSLVNVSFPTETATVNVVLVGVEIDLLTTSFRGDSSVRLRNIERLEQFLSTVEQKKGFITYITDKSYNLTSKNFADNKGFTGQGATLENF